MTASAATGASPISTRGEDRSLPLAVDMDGTLLRVDTLYEAFASALFHDPIATLLAFLELFRGIAAFKRRIVEISQIDADMLPLREDFVSWLQTQRDSGRILVLATAADRSIATAIADRLDLFDAVYASDGVVNLKSKAKALRLQTAFPDGFAYAGDSRADIAVWRCAAAAVVISRGGGLEQRARAVAPVVEQVFADAPASFAKWMDAARIHQWMKNALVLVPILLGWNMLTKEGAFWAVQAMALLCILASLTYLINDIADLSADRRHWSKQKRPFASGELPVRDGLLVAGFGFPLVLAAGMLIGPAVTVCLIGYLVTTLAYSFGLKRAPFLDTFVIASLFTLRVLLGTTAAKLPASAWLYAFSMFFFFSLAVAKRHAELLKALERGASGRIKGRGYDVEDRPLTLAFGVSSGIGATVILVIYLVEEIFKVGAYAHPEWLWIAPGVIFLWLVRIWLLAHRGQMLDDPVVFALSDRLSLGMGALAAVGLVLALI